ncbi:Flp pilus assembly protein CpaB [Elusimicrobiota bacterium]
MKKLFAPGLIALILAVLYFFMLQSREKQFTQAYGQPVGVLVAKYDIPERTLLKPESMSTIAYTPRKFVQQDAVEIKSVADFKKVKDLVSLVRIPKGNQIIYTQLASITPDTGLAVKVPPGLRAASVSVEADIMGLTKPGDRVDILCTFSVTGQGGGQEFVTATILQNILVLSVGGDMGAVLSPEEQKKKKKSSGEKLAISEEGFLSVAVSPLESQFLILGKKQGDISVVLRPLGDIEKHFIEMASFRKLFK